MLFSRIFLIVKKRSGGRWRFLFDVQATPPLADDVIMIEGALGKTGMPFEL